MIYPNCSHRLFRPTGNKILVSRVHFMCILHTTCGFVYRHCPFQKQVVVNEFTDMTPEEKAQLLGLVVPPALQGRKLRGLGDFASEVENKGRELTATTTVPNWSTGGFGCEREGVVRCVIGCL